MQIRALQVAAPAPRMLRWRGIAVLLAAVALIGIVPYLGSYAIRVADSVLIYTLLGIGLNLVVGYAGLLDLGFVAFYAVGAYTYALLASPQFGIHLPFLLVLPIGAALGACFGILLGIPVLRLRGDYLAVVTLGFGEIIRVLLNNADAMTNGPQGIIGIDRARVFGIALSRPVDFFWVLLVACLVCGTLVYRLERSLLGQAWAAIREDQDAARGVGINTTRAKLAAFAISASIGGLAGVIFAAFQRYVSPESFSLNESILIVLIIVIGGVGNIFGVLLGAVVLVLLPELLREFAAYRMLVLGVVMAVLIVLRPQGLLPRRLGPGELLALLRGQPQGSR
jgi:branched-chain amino acid transport system permease protein